MTQKKVKDFLKFYAKLFFATVIVAIIIRICIDWKVSNALIDIICLIDKFIMGGIALLSFMISAKSLIILLITISDIANQRQFKTKEELIETIIKEIIGIILLLTIHFIFLFFYKGI